MNLISLAFAALFASVWLAAACASDTAPTQVVTLPQAVGVESISPSSGPPGTAVVIRGSGFTSTDNNVGFRHAVGAQEQQTAYLNEISSSDGKTLRFSLPDNDNVLLRACAFSQANPPEEGEPHEVCPDIGYLLPTGGSEMFVINKDGESSSVTFTVLPCPSPEPDNPCLDSSAITGGDP